MHFKKLVPALALTVAITGCTTNPYTGESQTSKGAWGALAVDSGFCSSVVRWLISSPDSSPVRPDSPVRSYRRGHMAP